MEQQTIPPVA